MPEGPEIWRSRDQIADALVGRKVRDIFFAHEHLKKYEEILTELRVEEIVPRGKAILTSFENGLNIYSHNQLYGKWFVTEAGVTPDTNRQLRLAIKNTEYSALLYSASEIEVLNRDALNEHDYLNKLGPDILHPDTGFDEIYSRFSEEQFQNRKLTTLLLDQGFISGIGNYLRSEILFYAGVPPSYRPVDCSTEQWESLAEAALKLSERSYETGGITVDPDIVEALKREGKERKDYRRFVYKREEEYCFKCGNVVEMQETGGRKLYYCPGCQGME